MRASCAVPIIVAMCASTGALAQMHKWVDEKGVTHYSDRPPVNQPSTPVSASGAAPAPYPDTMVPVSARPAASADSARAKLDVDRKRQPNGAARTAEKESAAD